VLWCAFIATARWFVRLLPGRRRRGEESVVPYH